MSGWTGVVVAGLALAIAVGAIGQPLWQVRLTNPPQTIAWTYGLFGATNTSVNTTSNSSSAIAYTYPNLPKQPNMAAAFLEAQRAFLLAFVAQFAAAALSVGTGLRRLRGMYAGIAFAAACVLNLYASLSLVLSIPPAASDLPRFAGVPITQFEGQAVETCGSSSCAVLNYGPGLEWYLLLGLGILLAFGATEVWYLRPAARAAVANTASAARTLPPPPAPPEKVEPVIQEVFVVGSNGLLIKHMSRSLMREMDRDVVGGMISVVSSFVREAFPERDGTVKEVSLGDHRFVMASERGLVVAALVTRGETEDVLPRLRHLLAVLIDRYGTKLEDWQGESLDGIEDEIAVLWEPFFAPPPPTD
jgi:hypothetical protein